MHFTPETLPTWNGLPPRTRNSLERQLHGMAKVIGFRELFTESERYGGVRTGKIEALYEVDLRTRMLRVYQVRSVR